MIKAAVISIFSLGLFGLFTSDDGVFIKHNTPEFMEAGATETISVVITKAELQGFGKLVIEIPPGFTAEAGDSQKASFTFNEQKAKLIWMAMPAEPEFTVTYHLTAPESFKGVVNLDGVFSYIKSNQRIDYQLPEKTIEAGAMDVADNSMEQDPETVDTNLDSSNMSVEDLGCKREFERVADDKILVTVTVFESELRGFGKILDSFDSKYEVIGGDSDGAITTFEDGSVKYVWFEVPEQDEFFVSYYIKHADLAFEEPEINGAFTYVYDEKPVEVAIQQVNTLEPVGDLADNVDGVQEDEPDTSIEENVDIIEDKIDEVETELVDNNLVVDSEPDPEPDPEPEPEIEVITEKTEVTQVQDPETGITYKVQIVAGHNTVGKTYMRKLHGFYDRFNIENHEGWVKYTTGQFDEYKGARDHRETINGQYNFDGPFVTAYNEGERITVQEALMISNQKWYQ